jgi:hypothetical protein
MGRITVTNGAIGARARVNIGPNGIISDRARRRVHEKLGTPPGLPGAGPLGEVGPQRPPETPGWEYQFTDLGDGRVQALPRRIAEVSA